MWIHDITYFCRIQVSAWGIQTPSYFRKQLSGYGILQEMFMFIKKGLKICDQIEHEQM